MCPDTSGEMRGFDLVADGRARSFEHFDGGVDVHRVPVHHRVQAEAEPRQLVLHPGLIRLVKMAAAAEGDLTREAVARLPDVELVANHAAVIDVIDELQHM